MRTDEMDLSVSNFASRTGKSVPRFICGRELFSMECHIYLLNANINAYVLYCSVCLFWRKDSLVISGILLQGLLWTSVSTQRLLPGAYSMGVPLPCRQTSQETQRPRHNSKYPSYPGASSIFKVKYTSDKRK